MESIGTKTVFYSRMQKRCKKMLNTIALFHHIIGRFLLTISEKYTEKNNLIGLNSNSGKWTMLKFARILVEITKILMDIKISIKIVLKNQNSG